MPDLFCLFVMKWPFFVIKSVMSGKIKKRKHPG